jgi:dTDP-glucose pyrophosphorylase
MAINKVVIAAAGQGTRMKRLTKNKSKHLIKVNQKPFLAYVLDNLLSAGYKEFILVTGFGADLMENFLKDYGYKAQVVNQYEILGPKEKIYGTACPLMCVKDIIGKEQFISIYGDNLYSIDDLKRMQKEDEYCYIGALEHKNPEKYGVLITEGEQLKEIIEKPKEYVGNLINTGLYKFTPDVFEKIPLIKKSPRGEYELTDVISLLAKEGKVKVLKLNDGWMDFGNPGDIRKCSKFLKDGSDSCKPR